MFLCRRNVRRLAGARPVSTSAAGLLSQRTVSQRPAARWKQSARRVFGRGPVVPTQPTQQTATFGGPASPDGTDNIRIQPARPFGPPFQPGQPGQRRCSRQSSRSRSAAPNMPPTRAQVCDMSLTLGRVGDDVVLTGDLLHGIEELMAHNAAAFRRKSAPSNAQRWLRK